MIAKKKIHVKRLPTVRAEVARAWGATERLKVQGQRDKRKDLWELLDCFKLTLNYERPVL
jgi:hypothetical protein